MQDKSDPGHRQQVPIGLMVQPPAEARWMVHETYSLFFTFLKARMESF
jgi:hypothetical protein